MRQAGIQPLDTLVSKEGLGITNGTCAMTSVGALYLYDTMMAARLAHQHGAYAAEAAAQGVGPQNHHAPDLLLGVGVPGAGAMAEDQIGG